MKRMFTVEFGNECIVTVLANNANDAIQKSIKKLYCGGYRRNLHKITKVELLGEEGLR